MISRDGNNFASGNHNGPPWKIKITRIMEIIIMIICFFAWIGQALNDGGNVK